jgi:hypothetical protein
MDPAALAEITAAWRNDPERFVRECFPWGEPGPLRNETGPDAWQTDVLRLLRDGLSPQRALQIAIASGHGIGKSCLVAWIILWAISTETDTRGIITAGTAGQLSGRTWAELGKWFQLTPLLQIEFELTATAIASKTRTRTWRLDAVAWSENKPESFAGLHNAGRRVVVIFDEASIIPDIIWETATGAMSDENTERIFLACGNPIRPDGRFFECWNRFRNFWITRKIDSRTAKLTDKAQIEELIQAYGEDSDYCRQRITGEFPRSGSQQFISSEVVAAAAQRRIEASKWDPVILGVDIARQGADRSVIFIRRGLDAWSIPPIKLSGSDLMTLAAHIVEIAHRWQADAVFLDETGMGYGVLDRLRQLRLNGVVGINFGAKAQRTGIGQDASQYLYKNMRAFMWGQMRDWLNHGAIPNDQELLADLTAPSYGYAPLDGRDAIILERKEDMRRRGLASPDIADALALTFALPVSSSKHSLNFSKQDVGDGLHEWRYDPLSQPAIQLPGPNSF